MINTMSFSRRWLPCVLALYLMIGYPGVVAYCPEIGTAIYEYGFRCFNQITGPFDGRGSGGATIEQVLATDLYWKTYCSSLNGLDDCFSGDDFSGCSQVERTGFAQRTREIVKRELGKRGLYPDTESLCQGTNLTDTITELYSRLDSDQFSHCAAGQEVQLCLEPWYEEAAEFNQPADEGIALFKRWAIATRQCLYEATNNTCDSTHQEIFDLILNQTTPDVIKGTIDWPELGPPDQKAILSLRNRSTVGVFGDPHLLTYKSSSLQTCAAEGTRDYLLNYVIRMVGDNRRITLSGWTRRATFLRKFTLSFYGIDGSLIGKYEADEIGRPYDISGSFSGGERNFSIGNDILTVTKSDTVVKIVATHIAATIEIRANGFHDYGFYTLALRMGDAILDKSRGLLITGCGVNERLTDPEVGQPARRKRSTQEQTCANECAKVANMANFLYNETCYFDCVTTESTNIGMLSNVFKDSLINIVEDDKQLPLVDDSTTTTRVPPMTSPEPNKAANGQHSPGIVIVSVIYLLITHITTLT